MNQKEKTQKLLTDHHKKYPLMQICDMFKFLHQSSFGCEHAVSSADHATELIKKEAEGLHPTAPEAPEALDGAYSRVPLSRLFNGLSAETLGKLFAMSAKTEKDGTANLKEKLKVAEELIDCGELPFDSQEFFRLSKEWEEQGFPALHHSPEFRSLYHPSYRVISKDYIPFLPLFAKLDTLLSKGSVRLAIEGGSASGKTTLGALLEQIYNCTVFHMDDFFLRPEQRTPLRLAEPGGNVDRERFLEEVLIPLGKNETVNYRPFNCQTAELSEAIPITPKKLTVTEGAYSMHPDLAKFYDYSVFLDIDAGLQKKRIEKRNSPQMANRFFTQWIPLEQKYFEKLNIKQNCKMTIPVTE